MIEAQVFLLFFGAVLTLIGVIVFFLLAWFKETTGESNVVKILQAEFRLSNPGLVIFIGGLGLMVAPIFLDQRLSGDTQPDPTPTVAPSPTLTPTPQATVIAPEPSLTPVPIGAVTPVMPTDTPVPPTPTATPEPPTPTPSPTPTPAPELVDLEGRWSNLHGYVDFFSNSVGGYDFVSYNNFGQVIAQGTASFDGFVVNSSGTNAFGWNFSLELFLIDDSTLQGTQYDAFGNQTQFITLIRQNNGFR